MHRLSDDLGVKVFVRVYTEQISEKVGTAAPNFYTPSHHHVRTNPKVVGEGAPFVYNGKYTHTQKYTFPGKWGLKLKTGPLIEELVENEEFLAYMQRVAEGKYAIFTDEFCRKNPKIFLSITSPSTPGSIGSENPPPGPYFGVSPDLFPATAVQDADNLRAKMLALEYTEDDDESQPPTPQQPPPNFPPVAQQPPNFSPADQNPVQQPPAMNTQQPPNFSPAAQHPSNPPNFAQQHPGFSQYAQGPSASQAGSSFQAYQGQGHATSNDQGHTSWQSLRPPQEMQPPRGHQRAIKYPATHPMQNQFGGKQEYA